MPKIPSFKQFVTENAKLAITNRDIGKIFKPLKKEIQRLRDRGLKADVYDADYLEYSFMPSLNTYDAKKIARAMDGGETETRETMFKLVAKVVGKEQAQLLAQCIREDVNLSLINENVEDEQSEAIGEISRWYKFLMDNGEKQSYLKKVKRDYEKANGNFSQGYEEDNDGLMYDGLDQLEGLAKDLKKYATRKHKLDAKTIKKIEDAEDDDWYDILDR